MSFIYYLMHQIHYLLWIIIIYFRLLIKLEDKQRYKEKFVITNKNNSKKLPCVWIHGASVGEIKSARKLMELLSKAGYFVLCTTITQDSANLFKNIIQMPNVIHQYFPCDTKVSITKFLDYWKPEFTLFMESEIWPFIINQLGLKSKLYLINGRLSNKSYKNWKIFPSLLKAILKNYTYIFSASSEDVRKFNFFNFKNVKYIGNTKSDQINFLKADLDPLIAKYNMFYTNFNKNKQSFVISYCSVHLQEIKILIDQFIKMKKEIKNATLIIAPRNLIQIHSISNFIKENNLTCQFFDNLNVHNNSDVIIFNKFNIMPLVYNISNISVVCGSFVENIGGHNPIEPITFNKITIVGPYYEKSKQIILELKNKNALIITNNLSQDVISLYKDKNYQNKILFNISKYIEFAKDNSVSREILNSINLNLINSKS